MHLIQILGVDDPKQGGHEELVAEDTKLLDEESQSLVSREPLLEPPSVLIVADDPVLHQLALGHVEKPAVFVHLDLGQFARVEPALDPVGHK
jgi:hypothetical protein